MHHVALTLALGAACQAPLEAAEGTLPLEVKERDQHQREADVDGDDHGPGREVLFDSLESHFAVVKFESTAGLVMRLAPSDNPNLIRALKHDLLVAIGLLHILGRDYFGNKFGLILPEVGPVIAQHEYLTVFWDCLDVDAELDGVHLCPHIRQSANFSLLVHQLHDARTGWILESLRLSLLSYVHKRCRVFLPSFGGFRVNSRAPTLRLPLNFFE